MASESWEEQAAGGDGDAGEAAAAPGQNASAKEWRPSATASEWKPSWLREEPPAAAPDAGADAGAAETAEAPAFAPEVAPAAPTEAPSQDDIDASLSQAAAKVVISSKPAVPEPVAVAAAPTEAAPAEAAVAAESQTERPVRKTSIDESALEEEFNEGDAATADADPRPHLNVVTIGHVDAGKSTLSGSILFETGKVDERTIAKYEAEAKERNRESWFLAYIMDESPEEREKGKTVEVGRAYFATENRRLTILDAPGHKNYVPAMISGASQADVGILVISARKGEFESGFIQAGQTREHAMLAKTLGISKLLVAVNKMDEQTVQWSQERYDDIVKRLRPFLKGCGFKVKRDVSFLPISALTGKGVLRPISKETCGWASELNGGKSLLQLLDEVSILGRDPRKPLRATIVDKYTDRGVVLMAKVETGILYVGQTVCVCPNQTLCKVESITIDDQEVPGARPGENVLARLAGLSDAEVGKGHVLASQYAPVDGCREVLAQLFIVSLLEHRPLFSAGYNAVFHAHTAEEECTVYEIAGLLDADLKRIVKKKPAFAKAGSNIVCKIRLSKSICLEPYDKLMQLGRFTLRDEGTTIAIGIIKLCR